MDTVSKTKRGEIMSKVRHGNTEIEQILRRKLWISGYKGYRISPNLPGKPDIFYSRAKLAIFVDGCFWHGCEICARFPKSNVDFWQAKITRNKNRDATNDIDLKEKGIRVLRFWEHEIKESPQSAFNIIANFLGPNKN